MTNGREPTLTIPCPECKAILVIRTVKQTGVRFLACPTWPSCNFTMELPAYWHMMAAGNEMLPGFEP
jgi:ssDNA-binding Zn-finger/Zn-ribbon topoisomerase 1